MDLSAEEMGFTEDMCEYLNPKDLCDWDTEIEMVKIAFLKGVKYKKQIKNKKLKHKHSKRNEILIEMLRNVYTRVYFNTIDDDEKENLQNELSRFVDGDFQEE